MVEILKGENIPEHLRKERDGNVKIKLIGLNLIYTHGENVSKVSEIIGVSTRTIYRWINEWNTRGYDGLFRKGGSPGRPPRYSREEITKLSRLLESKLFWRVKDVRDLLESHLGLKLSECQLRRVLRDSMGMAFSRPYFCDESRLIVHGISLDGLKKVILMLEKKGIPQDFVGIGVLKKEQGTDGAGFFYSALIGEDVLVLNDYAGRRNNLEDIFEQIRRKNDNFRVLVMALDPFTPNVLPPASDFEIIPRFIIWYLK